jgi:diketogulonate reductase-like aldo/keto reductase
MGPGRKDPGLLAWCIQQGVVIYPSVPNTTRVTQEMDQVYGGFKTDYRKSLQQLVTQEGKLVDANQYHEIVPRAGQPVGNPLWENYLLHPRR